MKQKENGIEPKHWYQATGFVAVLHHAECAWRGDLGSLEVETGPPLPDPLFSRTGLCTLGPGWLRRLGTIATLTKPGEKTLQKRNRFFWTLVIIEWQLRHLWDLVMGGQLLAATTSN